MKEKIDKAIECFKKQDWNGAIDLFTSIIEVDIENAEVYIVHNLNDYQEWRDGSYHPKEIFVYGDESTYDKMLAQGHTNSNGLAVINFDEDTINRIQNERKI